MAKPNLQMELTCIAPRVNFLRKGAQYFLERWEYPDQKKKNSKKSVGFYIKSQGFL